MRNGEACNYEAIGTHGTTGGNYRIGQARQRLRFRQRLRQRLYSTGTETAPVGVYL